MSAPPDLDTAAAALGLEEGWVDSAGVRIHHVGGGSGPLVLFLHGFPEYWYSWRHQLPDIAASDRRAVAIDLRGYGRSGRPTARSSYAMEHLVADVAAVVDELGGGRATVVGHDWGGVIAWAFAHAHPERLERLAIVNAPHPARFASEIVHPPQLLRSWYIFLFQIPRLPEALLSWNDGAVVASMLRHGTGVPDAFTPEDLRRFGKALAAPGAARAALDYYRNLPAGLRRRPAFTPIEPPVLLLWGEKDQALDLRLTRGNEAYVKHLEVHRFPGVGHFPHEEVPAAFNAELRRFVLESR